jgi:hypothetical protein
LHSVRTGIDFVIWNDMFSMAEINPAQPGSLLKGSGDHMSEATPRNTGCVGAIVDSAVRDVAKMRAMGFAVWARGTCAYDSLNRQRIVDVDVPVEIDGVRFSAGDLVIADIDGVVVVPQQVEAEAIRRAWEKVHAENVTRDAIKAGDTLPAIDELVLFPGVCHGNLVDLRSRRCKPRSPGRQLPLAHEEVAEKLDRYRGWRFPHHLGHGIGLAAHEAPRLNPEWDDTLAEGDVVTVEPTLYSDELRGGVRIEQDNRVTADGIERLSSFPTDL